MFLLMMYIVGCRYSVFACVATHCSAHYCISLLTKTVQSNAFPCLGCYIVKCRWKHVAGKHSEIFSSGSLVLDCITVVCPLLEDTVTSVPTKVESCSISHCQMLGGPYKESIASGQCAIDGATKCHIGILHFRRMNQCLYHYYFCTWAFSHFGFLQMVVYLGSLEVYLSSISLALLA